ncbi:unnamed protein product [Schistosoma mattheei]|uniref:Uncharacterized protein n=1 Tax=Schistosoma mattheei TaxID=31246 RepID=A0A183NDJ9_9TREM|nr:unnamed protein product [Schistosoma mattheei]
MLAFQQQLFKAVLGKLFTQPKYKESIYDADNGAVMDISEGCPVEGLNLFIPEARCNIDMGSHNDSQNFDQISHKNGLDISAESNYGSKSNPILLDADFPSETLSTNEILNESEESV